jgi:hypothetical protein
MSTAEADSSPAVLAPAPPPGPGVQPPFVAPPTDGTRQRRWIAFGIAAGLALLCCVGGLIGLGGLAVLGTQVILNDAKNVVSDYLTAIQEHEYDRAYDLLCPRQRAQTSESEFAESFAEEKEISSFEVGDPDAADIVIVPATLHYVDGSDRDVRFRLDQDSSTGEFRVCGLEG